MRYGLGSVSALHASASASPTRSARFQLLESRRMLAAVNWVGGAAGLWDQASNWSNDAVPTSADDVTINTTIAATISIQSSDTESIRGLTVGGNDVLSIIGGSLTVTGNATVTGNFSMSGGSFTAAGAGIVASVGGTTKIVGGSLIVAGGATLSLPQLINYAGSTGASPALLQATGVGSTLSLPALTTLQNPGNSDLNVEALAGGKVQMPALSNIGQTVQNTPPSNPLINFEADGSGSQLNISGLSDISSFGTNVAAVVDTHDATVLFNSNFTSVDGLVFTVDGTGTIPIQQFTSLTDGGITVEGGTYTLSNLINVDGSNIQAKNGGSLALLKLTSVIDGGAQVLRDEERAASSTSRV